MTIACPAIEAMKKALADRLEGAWRAYEWHKLRFVEQHPKATPDEIAAACREIGDKLGL